MKTNSPILILDDEPQHQKWLVDFIESKGYKVTTAISVNEAEKLLQEIKFRFVVIDLNVPSNISSPKGALEEKYPGLHAALFARNLGYRDRQVVLYSVHDSQAVRQEAERIGVRYILKGRPKEFKAEVVSILGYDPTEKT